MKHIDEHTLELYVLGAREVKDQKEAINQHLLECAGCRSNEYRLRAIYLDAGRAHDELANMDLSTLPVTLKRKVSVEPIWQSGILSVEPIYRHFWTKMKSYAVVHPAGVFGGVVLSFAAMGGLLALMLNSSFLTPSPSFVHLNPDQNLIEVYAKDRTKLWSIPASSMKSWEAENAIYGTSRVEVADLRGSGKYEVITTAPLAGMGSDQGRVRVFESLEHIRFERTIGDPSTFRGRQYLESMNAYPLVIVPAADGKGSEIFVAASSGRSPTVIARLNAEGKVLGEYWHFGSLHGLYAIDVEGDGRKMIVASGTSDIDDNLNDTGRSRAVLIVLDPLKLVGKRESRLTPGFGLDLSDAEQFYVCFPQSDIEKSLGVESGVRFVRSVSDSLLLVHVEGGGPSGAPVFDYLFTRNLTIASVKSNDVNAPLHERLKAQGKIRSTLNEAYLKDLRDRIEFLSVRH